MKCRYMGQTGADGGRKKGEDDPVGGDLVMPVDEHGLLTSGTVSIVDLDAARKSRAARGRAASGRHGRKHFRWQDALRRVRQFR